MCFHEFNLVCSLSGGPCIGSGSCSDYISKEKGEQKVSQGYKFCIAEKKWKKQNLNETKRNF